MSEGFVCRRGGAASGAVKKGTIAVNYTAGANCVVSDGERNYTAADLSGKAVFIVTPGTWTVRAYGTDGDSSRTVNVEAGSWVLVELGFSQKLFPVSPASSVWQEYSGPAMSYPALVSISDTSLVVQTKTGSNDDGGVVSKNKYDLSTRNTVQIKASYEPDTSGNFPDTNNTIALFVSPSNASSTQDYVPDAPCALTEAVASVDIPAGTDVTVTLDVSSISGEYFIGIGLDTAGGARTLTIEEVELL